MPRLKFFCNVRVSIQQLRDIVLSPFDLVQMFENGGSQHKHILLRRVRSRHVVCCLLMRARNEMSQCQFGAPACETCAKSISFFVYRDGFLPHTKASKATCNPQVKIKIAWMVGPEAVMNGQKLGIVALAKSNLHRRYVSEICVWCQFNGPISSENSLFDEFGIAWLQCRRSVA